MAYGATARGIIGATVANSHARTLSIMLSIVLLGAIMVDVFMKRGVQIDVLSVRTPGDAILQLTSAEKESVIASALQKLQDDVVDRLSDKLRGDAIVQLTSAEKAAITASALQKLRDGLKASSTNFYRTLKKPVPLGLASTGKDGSTDKHQCLASLLAKKKSEASASAAVGGGDIPGCDYDTCAKCIQAPLSPANTEQVALKRYIDASATVDVYKAGNPDILKYLKDGAGICPIGTWPSELSCLELHLEETALATKNQAKDVDYSSSPTNDQADILAQCDSVEEYVSILAAHQAEKDLQKFIKDTAVVTAYEEENPSITDYTDGTCPDPTVTTCPIGKVYVNTDPRFGGSTEKDTTVGDEWCIHNCNRDLSDRHRSCPADRCGCADKAPTCASGEVYVWTGWPTLSHGNWCDKNKRDTNPCTVRPETAHLQAVLPPYCPATLCGCAKDTGATASPVSLGGGSSATLLGTGGCGGVRWLGTQVDSASCVAAILSEPSDGSNACSHQYFHYADGTTDDSQPGDKNCGCLNEAGRDCETTGLIPDAHGVNTYKISSICTGSHLSASMLGTAAYTGVCWTAYTEAPELYVAPTLETCPSMQTCEADGAVYCCGNSDCLGSSQCASNTDLVGCFCAPTDLR
jgi:hypothetical protein